jgi:hypothetical protein
MLQVAYTTVVTFDDITMSITWLHLHKTYVSNNIKQKKWKETYNKKFQKKGTMLCYVKRLCANEMKIN